jgi:hypothetical protein
LLDRDVARLCPAQNFVDMVGGAPEQVRKFGPYDIRPAPSR